MIVLSTSYVLSLTLLFSGLNVSCASCPAPASKKATETVQKSVHNPASEKLAASTSDAKIETKNTTKSENSQQLKIAVVDPYKAMEVSEFGKQEAMKLEKIRKDLTDSYQKKEQALAQAMNDYKLKQSTLTPEARSAQENRMIDMRSDLESTRQSSEQQLQLATQRATEKLTREIQVAIEEIASQGSYDIIVHSGTALFVSPELVITDQVIKIMNKNYAKTQVTEKKVK